MIKEKKAKRKTAKYKEQRAMIITTFKDTKYYKLNDENDELNDKKEKSL